MDLFHAFFTSSKAPFRTQLTLFCVLKGPVGLYHIVIDKCEHGDLEIKGSSWLLTVGGKHRSHCDQSCSMELL